MLLLGVVLGWQGLTARAALQDAQQKAVQLRTQLTDGDLDQARRTTKSMAADTDKARSRTDGVLWGAASHLPWIGSTFDAVSRTSAALDQVADKTLPPAISLADSMAGAPIKDGALPLQPLEQHQTPMQDAAAAARSADDSVSSIDPASVNAAIRDSFTKVQRQLTDLRAATAAAATSLDLVPAMLGSDKPHRYLLVVQNNAESRATGGMFGSWAVLDARQGKVSLAGQGGAGDIPRQERPVIPLQEQEEALYGDKLGTLFSDINFTPDFPRAAQMAAAMFDARPEPGVDGVISVDPVVLSYLLEVTGPVEVDALGVQKRLTAGNAVDVLLSELYRTQPADVQDVFFEVAAQRIFEKATSGAGDPIGLVRALSKGASEGRVLVWSRDKAQQDKLVGTRVGGDLPHDPDGPPQVGVYVNDATASKMEYYLDLEAAVSAQSCSADGVQELRSEVLLRSTAPKGAASLPPSVVGIGKWAPQGIMQLNVRLYGPVDGRISALKVDGKKYTIAGGTHDGRQVAVVPVRIKPGQSIEISAEMTSGPRQTGDPVLSTTPTAKKGPTRWEVDSACAS